MFFVPALFLALFSIGAACLPKDKPVEVKFETIEHVQEVE
jgi:hypothetical protein